MQIKTIRWKNAKLTTDDKYLAAAPIQNVNANVKVWIK